AVMKSLAVNHNFAPGFVFAGHDLLSNGGAGRSFRSSYRSLCLRTIGLGNFFANSGSNVVQTIIWRVLVSDFSYYLPNELIAQEPLADRAGSRMLHLDRRSGALHDRWFRDFPDLLRADDLVVFNNTRVFPARLYGQRRGVRAQALSPHNPAARRFL